MEQNSACSLWFIKYNFADFLQRIVIFKLIYLCKFLLMIDTPILVSFYCYTRITFSFHSLYILFPKIYHVFSLTLNVYTTGCPNKHGNLISSLNSHVSWDTLHISIVYSHLYNVPSPPQEQRTPNRNMYSDMYCVLPLL